MLKTEFKLNEERILRDGKYAPERIYRSVDNAFAKFNLPKTTLEDGTVRYTGTGNPRDYGAFGRLIISLTEKEWFIPFVDKWLWFNSDDGINENDFSIEDVLYHFTQKRSVLE